MRRTDATPNDNSKNLQDPIFYVTIPLHLHGDECVAFLNTTITGRPVGFLVDTGAQMTILRGRTVKPNTRFYPNNGASLSGIEPNGGQSYRSAGLAFGAIVCQDVLFESEFHLVRDDFQLNVDGIIGSDFLRKYRAVIDFGKSILKLYLPSNAKLPSDQIYESVVTADGPDAKDSPTSESSETLVPKGTFSSVLEPARSTQKTNDVIGNVAKDCRTIGSMRALDYDRILDVVDSEFVDANWSNSIFNTFSHPECISTELRQDIGKSDASLNETTGSEDARVNGYADLADGVRAISGMNTFELKRRQGRTSYSVI